MAFSVCQTAVRGLQLQGLVVEFVAVIKEAGGNLIDCVTAQVLAVLDVSMPDDFAVFVASKIQGIGDKTVEPVWLVWPFRNEFDKVERLL
jgi:hypothetical protein